MSLLREYIREVLDREVQIQPDSQIFCDMDGVLVQFGGKIIPMVNDLLDGNEPDGVEITRGYLKRLRKIRKDLGPDWRATSRSDLNLKPIRNFMMGVVGANPGPVFASMSPWPDAMQLLWPFITSSGHTVNLLSAPIRSRSPELMSAGEGKIIWAEKHLNPAPVDIIIVPAKSKADYATVGGVPNVLIDDKASTIEAWNAAGGVGILHVPGGSSATVTKLKELGL